jgi:hypothetical protein
MLLFFERFSTGDVLRYLEFRVHEPVQNSATYTIPFVLFFRFFILEFSFEGIRNSVYTNLYGILRNFAVLYRTNFAELCEI